jgi:hypothetical protein
MTYTDMTDEEYDALDEELTRTVPRFGPPGSDWLEQREMRQLGLTKTSTDYLLVKAAATHRSPGEIINELIRGEIARTA